MINDMYTDTLKMNLMELKMKTPTLPPTSLISVSHERTFDPNYRQRTPHMALAQGQAFRLKGDTKRKYIKKI